MQCQQCSLYIACSPLVPVVSAVPVVSVVSVVLVVSVGSVVSVVSAVPLVSLYLSTYIVFAYRYNISIFTAIISDIFFVNSQAVAVHPRLLRITLQ